MSRPKRAKSNTRWNEFRAEHADLARASREIARAVLPRDFFDTEGRAERVEFNARDDASDGAGKPAGMASNRRKLSRERLDGEAAMLLRRHPSWSLAEVARVLGVARSRFSDKRRPLPTLRLVLGQLEVEKLERAARRRDSLGEGE